MHFNATSGAAILAVAQSRSVAGDVSANVQRHIRFMELASEQGAGFLMFPELSLTGYEPTLASALAMAENDSRLQPLRETARELGITAIVGAPFRSLSDEALLIAAFMFQGDGTQTLHFKQHLHSGEGSTFAPGTGGTPIDMGKERLSLAICADFCHATHAQQAAHAGTTVYAVSALISGAGYSDDSGVLRGYAQRHQMAVLLANYAGMTGGWNSGGGSALWDERGELIAEIPNSEEGMLVVQRSDSGWTAAVHTVVF